MDFYGLSPRLGVGDILGQSWDSPGTVGREVNVQNEKYLLARIPDDPWIPVDPQSTKSPLGLGNLFVAKNGGKTHVVGPRRLKFVVVKYAFLFTILGGTMGWGGVG